MPGSEIEQLLARLRSADPASAWKEFLEQYSALILQVAYQFDHDEDRIGDCYLFVCKRLARRHFKRLKAFNTGGPASFSTWLRTVVRNLCLDWRRTRFGRPHFPVPVINLPPIEREIYLSINHQGRTLVETISWVQALYPRLSRQEVLDAMDSLDRTLGAEGRHRKSSTRPRVESLSSEWEGSNGPPTRVAIEPGPDPEDSTSTRELAQKLRAAVDELPPEEQLMVRLRFEEELTLAEVARLTGHSNPQAVDRTIRHIQKKLQQILESPRKTSSQLRVIEQREDSLQDE